MNIPKLAEAKNNTEKDAYSEQTHSIESFLEKYLQNESIHTLSNFQVPKKILSSQDITALKSYCIRFLKKPNGEIGEADEHFLRLLKKSINKPYNKDGPKEEDKIIIQTLIKLIEEGFKTIYGENTLNKVFNILEGKDILDIQNILKNKFQQKSKSEEAFQTLMNKPQKDPKNNMKVTKEV
ncbi:hypothetical protein [Candidatus Absconditicoccus praedator]|uniref:hypothetical protein n=1 Tax=Candidatus Absconditicoccus praedator TaxID=2735562 RepID=UPI001E3401C4|nr:hypothetical protein [Candidatus Absconditicoccus praedator]UFX83032.1 hypothetical protein HLG78_02755 [Candidatus Absconditicoccus praedator]